ncbi:Phosphotransferase enzyme [Tulasnella sp. JGI-2019a]|nr:Phosphotransferase enzyme [Tulasnella sp. JGI-2019a]
MAWRMTRNNISSCIRPLRVGPRSSYLHQLVNALGTKASHEDFFRYTSGRFLMNEAEQLAQRYRKFSVEGLKAAAVSAIPGGLYCTSFTKLGEGGFNKAFLLSVATSSGSKDIVAKIPHPCAGPAHNLTASEVATLDFCRTVLELPVPQVLGWSSCADSTAVGAEYILMERAEGVQLVDRWDGFALKDMLTFEEDLLKVQARMLETRFGANGSLYYRNDIPESQQHPGPLITHQSKELLSVSNADLERWCIGPTADRDFYSQGKDVLNINRGPWGDAQSYTQSIVDRQIKWFQESPPSPRPPNHPFHRLDSQEDQQAHITLLRRFSSMLQILLPSDPRLTAPVLAHEDLHCGNIFVTTEGTPSITCLIDWQGMSLKPLFMQARLPLAVDRLGIGLCDRPTGLDPKWVPNDMSEEDWKTAAAEFMADYAQFEYQGKLNDVAPDYVRALASPGYNAIVRAISTAGNTYSTEIYPDIWRLRNHMKVISEQWDRLENPQPCPVSFSAEELEDHEGERTEFETVAKQLEIFEKYLGMKSDGWVDSRDYDRSVEASKELRELYESTMKDSLTAEELKKYWLVEV